ncbi:hypothetical protein VCHA49P379_280015 [Vibrio chagasii]|nr:hypothetical protein VCHA49P379_280015 [Vibrio chagasii]
MLCGSNGNSESQEVYGQYRENDLHEALSVLQFLNIPIYINQLTGCY